MKKYITILLFVCFYLKAKPQFVIDSPFINERFWVYNGLFHYKIWGIPEFILQNKDQFSLSEKERYSFLKKIIDSEIYPSSYLFHEESYWTKRVFKSIDIQKVENQKLLLLKAQNDSISLGKFILSRFEHPKLDVFTDSNFVNLLQPNEIDSSFFRNVNFLEIKEDWSYNSVKQEMECYITGIGIGVMGRKEKYWLYYPQLKNKISSEFPLSELIQALKNRTYTFENVRVYGNNYGGMVKDEVYQNDYDVLLFAKIFEDEIKQLKKTGKIKSNSKLIFTSTGTVEGDFSSPELNGKFTKKSSNGQVLLELNYQKGLLNGSFKLFFENGKIKQEGMLINGQIEGVIFSYFKEGQVLSKKNYQGGILDGEQICFYQNNQVRNHYYFFEGKLSGMYKSYFSDGKLMEAGTFAQGLLSGDWEYHLRLPKEIHQIIKRNPVFFESNFSFGQIKNKDILRTGEINFKVKYVFTKNDKCLNKLCSVLEVVE